MLLQRFRIGIAKTGADVGIVLKRLDGSLTWSLNGDDLFTPPAR